jgi:hypothetical protein
MAAAWMRILFLRFALVLLVLPMPLSAIAREIDSTRCAQGLNIDESAAFEFAETKKYH